jgi:hypothetical protein
MISIEVSSNYNNKKLIKLISKKNVSINECILDYGVLLYDNQNEIIKNNNTEELLNKLKETKDLYDESIKKINEDNNIAVDKLYKEKIESEEKLRKTFGQKEKDYMELIDRLENKQIELEKNLRESFTKKEKEYYEIINNIEQDKLIEREKYLKDINSIEVKIKEEYHDKIKYLESDIDKMKNEKTLEISTLIEKGKLLTKEEYEKIVELHLKRSEELKTTYDNLINELNSKNNNLDNTIRVLQTNNHELNNKLIDMYKKNENNNLDNINGNINLLNNKFSNYFDKIFKGNTEKGNYGEDFIENYLIDKFTNSKIIDTHKESAKGDIFFVFDKIKLLIESKNVQVLKKDDIDKFYRDIELQTSKNNINCALLISLNDTNLVNGKRHFHFEFKNNIPVIMISNIFNNTEFIRFAILTLNYLVKNGYATKDTDDEKIYIIILALNEIFDIIKMQMNYLQNDKHLIIKLEESFKKRESDLFNINKLFKNIFLKYPEISINSKETIVEEDSFNDIILKIKHKIEETPNFIINLKNLDEINIPSNLIKKIGGIKKINDYFKNNKKIEISKDDI